MFPSPKYIVFEPTTIMHPEIIIHHIFPNLLPSQQQHREAKPRNAQQSKLKRPK